MGITTQGASIQLTLLERAILHALKPLDTQRVWRTLGELRADVENSSDDGPVIGLSLASVNNAVDRLVRAGLAHRSGARPRMYSATRAGVEAVTR